MQTGIDLVCGPEGELCACYHNGYELPSGEEITAYDGDFFVCWLDTEPKKAAGASTVDDPSLPIVTTLTPTSEENCAGLSVDGADTRQ